MAAEDISKLKDVVMNVVNGIANPLVIIVQQAQDQIAKTMADLEYTVKQTPIVVPQMEKIGEEIAKIESLKLKNIGLIEAKTYEVMPIDEAITVQQNALEVAKKAQQAAKDADDRAAARAKAKGKEYKKKEIKGDNSIEGMQNAIKKQQDISDQIHDKIKELENENRAYDEDISKKQYELKILGAQLNPSGALIEAQAKFAAAREKVIQAQAEAAAQVAQAVAEATQMAKDTANDVVNGEESGMETEDETTQETTTATQESTTQNNNESESKEEETKEAEVSPAEQAKQAEADMAKAEEEMNTMQQISDDYDKAVEQIVAKNEPKMMQLRAEFQVMASSVTAINYLVTNIGTLASMIPSTPSTLVAGSAVGTANPAFLIPWGNVLYGYAWAILANAKAASIRFLAIAQEIDYVPKEEMATISSIATAEGTLMGLASIAPASTTLV